MILFINVRLKSLTLLLIRACVSTMAFPSYYLFLKRAWWFCSYDNVITYFFLNMSLAMFCKKVSYSVCYLHLYYFYFSYFLNNWSIPVGMEQIGEQQYYILYKTAFINFYSYLSNSRRRGHLQRIRQPCKSYKTHNN